MEFASILNDGIGGPVNERQKEFLAYISSAARDLIHLVEDFLDSSRLRQRALRVDRRAHTIEALFDHVRPTIASYAQMNAIAIEEDVAPGLPEVYCDLDKAGRTLVNLAVNAVKFSPDGAAVTLSARAREGGGVAVDVTDRGPGMTEEQAQTIGARFCVSSSDSAAGVKGFGLGLSIAAELVRLNLGRMHVRSALDVGSTFGFTLPACDPRRVLERYVELMREVDEDVAVTVLGVSPETPDTPIEAIRSLLVSVCYPMDLVLHDATANTAVVVGVTTDVDRWVARIQAEGQAKRETSDELGPFRIGWRGSWTRGELADGVMRCVLDQLGEGRHCA